MPMATKDSDAPDRAFLDRENRTYPVMHEAEGEWVWDCDLIAAAVKRARANEDERILKKALDLQARVCGEDEEDEEEE